MCKSDYDYYLSKVAGYLGKGYNVQNPERIAERVLSLGTSLENFVYDFLPCPEHKREEQMAFIRMTLEEAAVNYVSFMSDEEFVKLTSKPKEDENDDD